MADKIIISKEKSVYLDTSFIFNALSTSYNKEKEVVENTQEVFGLLSGYKVGKCYISNITINELFNTIERQGFRAFIDNKIIKQEKLTEEEWKVLHPSQKDTLRYENDKKLGFNYYDIKTWRIDEHKEDYKIYVYNEFHNIIDSLKNLKYTILSNFKDSSEYDAVFIKTIKKLNKLDSNDLNHFLLCMEYNIDGIITCDSDFNQINQNGFEIVHIDKDYNGYED